MQSLIGAVTDMEVSEDEPLTVFFEDLKSFIGTMNSYGIPSPLNNVHPAFRHQGDSNQERYAIVDTELDERTDEDMDQILEEKIDVKMHEVMIHEAMEHDGPVERRQR